MEVEPASLFCFDPTPGIRFFAPMSDLKAGFTELILAEHSRKQAELIAAEVGPDAERFAVFWALMEHGQPPLPQRASYAMMVLVTQHPFLFDPFWNRAITMLERDYHIAVHRHLLRVMTDLTLPKDAESLGRLANYCFGVLQNATQPVGLQVNAMQVLFNICQLEPELSGELRMVIESLLPYGTSGFNSRAKRLLKKLK